MGQQGALALASSLRRLAASAGAAAHHDWVGGEGARDASAGIGGSAAAPLYLDLSDNPLGKEGLAELQAATGVAAGAIVLST